MFLPDGNSNHEDKVKPPNTSCKVTQSDPFIAEPKQKVSRARGTIRLCLVLGCLIFCSCKENNPVLPPPKNNIWGRLLFGGYDSANNPGIFVANMDGSGLKELVHSGDTVYNHDRTPLSAGPGIVSRIWNLGFAHWNRDGTKILYDETMGIDESHISMMNANGTDRHIVVINGYDQGGNLSPDGRRILYFFGMMGILLSMDVIDTSGNNDSTLLDITPFHAYYLDPKWFPDGNEVYYSICGMCDSLVDTTSEIYSIELSTHKTRQITHNNIDERHFVLSPTGSRIVYARYNRSTDTSTTLYSMDLATNVAHEIVDVKGWAYPVWLPSGNGIVFVDSNAVYSINIDGTSLQKLYTLPFSPFISDIYISDGGE